MKSIFEYLIGKDKNILKPIKLNDGDEAIILKNLEQEKTLLEVIKRDIFNRSGFRIYNNDDMGCLIIDYNKNDNEVIFDNVNYLSSNIATGLLRVYLPNDAKILLKGKDIELSIADSSSKCRHISQIKNPINRLFSPKNKFSKISIEYLTIDGDLAENLLDSIYCDEFYINSYCRGIKKAFISDRNKLKNPNVKITGTTKGNTF